MSEPSVVVLGLGGIGSATAYWLSRRLGSHVLGIEQFGVGHERGGSEDHSRIIRLSYHTPAYVELARRAYDAWEAVEDDGGESVVVTTGGLDLAPQDASIGLDDYRSSMSAAGVPFEELDAAQIMGRWPQWRLTDDVTGLFQERSGLVAATRANAEHRRLAVRNGARLIDHAPVESVREVGGEVEVVAGGVVHRAASLVVAAGAWTNDALAGLGVRFPLEVTLEQVLYLTPRHPAAFDPRRFPVWIWMDEPSFYGFPVFGAPAFKLGWDRCQVTTDPHNRPTEADSGTTSRMRDFVARHLPGADSGVHLAKTCLYTLTPDRDFIVDRVPGTANCWVAVGAGHAFKFAAVLGRILSDLAIDGRTDADVSVFAADRAILGETDPSRSYMV
jgi:sarcosine oxidase